MSFLYSYNCTVKYSVYRKGRQLEDAFQGPGGLIVGPLGLFLRRAATISGSAWPSTSGGQQICKYQVLFFNIRSLHLGIGLAKTMYKACKTELFEYSFGSSRDRPKILDPSRMRAHVWFGLIM